MHSAQTISVHTIVVAVEDLKVMDERAETLMSAKCRHTIAVSMHPVRTASVHSDASALMDMKVMDGNALTSMSVGLELTTVTLVLVV